MTWNQHRPLVLVLLVSATWPATIFTSGESLRIQRRHLVNSVKHESVEMNQNSKIGVAQDVTRRLSSKSGKSTSSEGKSGKGSLYPEGKSGKSSSYSKGKSGKSSYYEPQPARPTYSEQSNDVSSNGTSGKWSLYESLPARANGSHSNDVVSGHSWLFLAFTISYQNLTDIGCVNFRRDLSLHRLKPMDFSPSYFKRQIPWP